jgi:hypothetical protein
MEDPPKITLPRHKGGGGSKTRLLDGHVSQGRSPGIACGGVLKSSLPVHRPRVARSPKIPYNFTHNASAVALAPVLGTLNSDLPVFCRCYVKFVWGVVGERSNMCRA